MLAQRLLDIKGFSDAKVDKLLESAKALKHIGFISGTEGVLSLSPPRAQPCVHARALTPPAVPPPPPAALTIQKLRMKITTGSKDLDAILGGGVETGTITEIFGEGRSGKTQLVSTLCVTTQLSKEHGGGEGKVIVLDTDNKFR